MIFRLLVFASINYLAPKLHPKSKQYNHISIHKKIQSKTKNKIYKASTTTMVRQCS